MLTRVGHIAIESMEIPAYDPAGNMLFAAAGGVVSMIHLGDGASPTIVRTLRFGDDAGFPAGMGAEVTHVSLDPLGRGFGAATIVPADFAGVPGATVLFSTRTGRALARFVVGYNPDAAVFSPDGSRVLVANEGQPGVSKQGVLVDPPGSISVISLAGVTNEHDCARLTQSRVTTVYFDGETLAEAIDASARNPVERYLRIHPRNRATPSLDLEPEYIAFAGGAAYITLQENNAIARFDPETMRFERITGLGLLAHAIDPTDDNAPGGAWEVVHGAPMPDQLVSFIIDGAQYLITPNEGDDRGVFGAAGDPLGDQVRVRDLAAAMPLSSSLRERIATTPPLASLMACAFSGDLNGDGMLDEFVVLGTRSATVWRVLPDGELRRVADTGDLFERTMAAVAPDRFNANGTATRESRSGVRGPEPEGVAVATLGARTIGFVGLERPGAIVALDLSEPASPRLLDLHVSADEGDIGPEGMLVIAARDSPTGAPLLVVAFEVSGTLTIYSIRDDEDLVNATSR